MLGFSRDLRVAFRLLLRTPGPTIAMLASLAVGLGTCTTVFSWINATLVEPFPAVARSGDYVVLASRTPSGGLEPLSYAGYGDLRDAAPVFDNIVAVGVTLNALNLGTGTEGQHTERVFANFVSGNYFHALGVTPELGRVFGPSEDSVPGRDAVVVISHGLWQRRFASAPDVIGRTVHLNGRPCTVIAVADRRFIGTIVGLSADLWIPIMMQPALVPGAASLENRAVRWILGLGRVKAGLRRGEAEARLQATSRNLAAQYPDTDDRQATLLPIWRSPWGAQGGTGPVLLMFAGVVTLLLMLSCANAANLLLVRAIGRRREIAARLALGASRARVVRLLLTESVVLALVAGALGLMVAFLSSDLILFFLPPTDSPFVFGRGVDGTVAVFGLSLACATVVLFGLAPALGASRQDLVTALKEAEGTIGATRSRLRGRLVVIQVALCVVMLAGAGLFLRSLQQAGRVSPGFNPDGVILATYDLSQLGYRSERGANLHQQLLARAAIIPGVETASLATRVPLGFTPLRSMKVTIDGYVPAPGEDLIVGTNTVAPDYFRVLQVPLQRGREFSERDAAGSETVAIVNETMARRYWGARDVLGLSIRVGERSVRIIGVVADSKYRALTEDPVPHLYLPVSQNYESGVTLHLRTTADAEAVLPLLRVEAQRLDPALVLSNIQSLKTHMGFATLVPRMSASLLGAFGGLALFVATLGVYSIVAFVVAARRRELGVRLAVGASPRSIRMLVIRYGLNVAGWGVILGVVLTAAIGRLITGLLVGVSPVDPLVFGGVILLIVAAVLGASFVPAAKAGRLDVMRVLRS